MKGNTRNGGFTIMELLVSVALFTATFVAVSNSFLTIVDSYRKVSSERVNVDNLSTAVESLVRGLKTGYNYHCETAVIPEGATPLVGIGNPRDCAVGGTFLAFEKAKGSDGIDTDQIVYKLSGGRLMRSDRGGTSGTFYPVTDIPSVVSITRLRFYVVGGIPLTLPAGTNVVQPKTVIVIRGIVGSGTKRSSSFIIQTTVTQRMPDII